MKLFISLDMEGLAGTYNWHQEEIERSTVRKLFYNEMECFLTTLLQHQDQAQIQEICIVDSHSGGDSLSYQITELDERVNLISGSPRPHYMMSSIDESYDYAFLIGYHAGTGAHLACMDHTYSNRRIHKIWVNKIPMNESLLNAAYASYYRVPVAIISGDVSCRNELLQPNALPWVEFVTTKEALGKFAAKNYSWLLIKNRYKEAIDSFFTNAKKGQYKLYQFTTPITITIEFQSTSMADVVSMMPYSQRIDGRTVSFQSEDYKVIFEALLTMVTLSYTVNP